MYQQNPNPLIDDSFLGSKYFNPDYLFTYLKEVFAYVFSGETLSILNTIISFFAIFFIAVIIYTTIRMFEIRRKEHAHLHHEIEEYKHHQKLKEEKERERGGFKNKRWNKVLDYLFSSNGNDWKLAVVEADTMLFDLLTQIGLKGDTLGDKLKSVSADSFPFINSAWEVHNIRNKIAHEGSAFEMSLHEAKRVISIYEDIFKSFQYI